MPGRFEEALAQNPAPKRLGDVTLRYQPSLLVGEAARPIRGALFALVLVAGSTLGLGTLGALISGAPIWAIGVTSASSAASFAAAALLDQRARRQRRFVLNFQTTSLRLDFSTPFAHRARTLVVHFDGVRDCCVYPQADGRFALTVDFVTSASSEEVLREVLVANIAPGEAEAASRLHRVLTGAFGLGVASATSP